MKGLIERVTGNQFNRGREGAVMEKEGSRKKSTFREQEKQQMKIRRSFIQRDLPCKRTGNFNKRLTHAEIMRAIRYLDRDVCAERPEKTPVRFSGFSSPSSPS
jgi:hypothetical protein